MLTFLVTWILDLLRKYLLREKVIFRSIITPVYRQGCSILIGRCARPVRTPLIYIRAARGSSQVPLAWFQVCVCHLKYPVLTHVYNLKCPVPTHVCHLKYRAHVCHLKYPVPTRVYVCK